MLQSGTFRQLVFQTWKDQPSQSRCITKPNKAEIVRPTDFLKSHLITKFENDFLTKNKSDDQTEKVDRVFASDWLTGVNGSTRITILSDSTRATLRNDVLIPPGESRFLINDSARVTVNDSALESGSFLQNLQRFH